MASWTLSMELWLSDSLSVTISGTELNFRLDISVESSMQTCTCPFFANLLERPLFLNLYRLVMRQEHCIILVLSSD